MTYRIRDINFVHNNQLNSSISKQQYTIPKATRFHHNKSQNSYKYYDIPTTNNQRAVPFSCSERKSIFDTIKNSAPSPDKYNAKLPNAQITHPISFAKGRSQCKVLNFLKISNTDNPGPGSYNPNPQFVQANTGTKYSIRARTQNSQKSLSLAPGPGKYSIKTSWLQKQKILSTDKKVGCPLIRPSKSKRQMINQQLIIDAPLYYPTKTKKGEQTFNKTGGFSIGKSLRFTQRIKTQNANPCPGPGTYDRFSQFI